MEARTAASGGGEGDGRRCRAAWGRERERGGWWVGDPGGRGG